MRIARAAATKPLAALIRRRGWKRVGFESARLAYDGYKAFADAITTAALVPAPGVVEHLRRVKDAGEIGRIEASVRLCSKAFGRALRMAAEADARTAGAVPSTKGSL